MKVPLKLMETLSHHVGEIISIRDHNPPEVTICKINHRTKASLGVSNEEFLKTASFQTMTVDGIQNNSIGPHFQYMEKEKQTFLKIYSFMLHRRN